MTAVPSPDSVTAASPAPSPAAVWSIIQGHTRFWATHAAVKLGVFDALRDGGRTAAELAPRLPASRAHLDVLLDALVGLDLLQRSGDVFSLVPVSAAYLTRGGERYMGDLVLHSFGRQENWPLLAGTVTGGAPVFPIDEDVRFWRDIARATFTTQRALASRTAAMLGLQGDVPLRLLDVGAGAAPWAVALLEALPNATAVANDLAEVVSLAWDAAAQHGVAARLTVEAGDFRVAGFAPAGFDVVVLGNVVRTEGDAGAPRLLRRALGWLRPGGTLLLADYVVDDERRDNLTALLLGVTMMANTICGRTFTEREFRGWLDDAGFTGVELLEPLPNNHVFVARRPESRDA
jgi:SAM-dependent methyltransferase